MHPIIDKDRKDRQKAVRVGILDTGIDARHPVFKRALDLNVIRGYKSFRVTLDPLSDLHGHGTHGASVFMRTAPHAAVFIARVANDDGEIPTDDNFAAIVEVYYNAGWKLMVLGNSMVC